MSAENFSLIVTRHRVQNHNVEVMKFAPPAADRPRPAPARPLRPETGGVAEANGGMSTAGDWDEATARTVGAAFVQFDGGSKGYLTRHELRCAHIALLGHPPSLVRWR